MKALGALVVFAAAAGLAGAALAASLPAGPQTTPLPTVTTVLQVTTVVPKVTSTVPKVTTTVPNVTTVVPKVTTTVPKVTTTAPAAPAPQPATATTAVANATRQATTSSAAGTASTGTAQRSGGVAGSLAGSPPPAGSSGGTTSSSSAGTSSPAPPQSRPGERVGRLSSTRPWIGTQGPKKRRTTTLTFVLRKATRVIFTVNQVSPSCLGIGHFGFAGRRGVNRVRFAGRVRGRELEPGTYRISVRTAAGQVVRRVTLVVVDGPAPTRDELRALRAADVCPDDTTTSSSFASASSSRDGGGNGGSVLGAAGTAAAEALPSPGGIDLTPNISAPDAPDITGGVLATSVEETARAIRPALVALLAIAIVLLALASVPRVAVAGGRTNDLLARHRPHIAALGAVALIATALTFLLG